MDHVNKNTDHNPKPANTVARAHSANACAPGELAQQIAQNELARLFAPPSVIPKRIVIAVSGGADSMAMMVLFAHYLDQDTKANPYSESEIVVATVDHGLRAASRDEAKFVASHAHRLGFKHITLPWQGEKPTSGIQEAARNARYRLLHACACADTAQPTAIMLAHHQGDQAETVLMRLARGSGVDGIAGMHRVEPSTGPAFAILWRPFIELPKARLVATLHRKNVGWMEDPSNANTDFERIRIRMAQEQRDALGLSDEALARTSRRMERASAALNDIADDAFRENVQTHNGAYTTVSSALISDAPLDIVIRVIAKTIAQLTPRGQIISLAKLEDHVARLRAAAPTPAEAFRATFGRCVFEFSKRASDTGASPATVARPVSNGLLVYCEPGRTDVAPVSLEPGKTVSWSGRFQVHLSKDAKSVVTVRALGRDALMDLRKDGIATATTLPAVVAPTLLSVWQEDRLITVPQLDFRRPGWNEPIPHIQWANRSISPQMPWFLNSARAVHEPPK